MITWVYAASPVCGGGVAGCCKGGWYHTVSLSWHCANQSLSYPINAEHQARQRQVSNLISHWFNSAGIQTYALPYGKPALYRFGHRDGSWCQTCDSACSWRLYSAVPLGYQAGLEGRNVASCTSGVILLLILSLPFLAFIWVPIVGTGKDCIVLLGKYLEAKATEWNQVCFPY